MHFCIARCCAGQVKILFPVVQILTSFESVYEVQSRVRSESMNKLVELFSTVESPAQAFKFDCVDGYSALFGIQLMTLPLIIYAISVLVFAVATGVIDTSMLQKVGLPSPPRVKLLEGQKDKVDTLIHVGVAFWLLMLPMISSRLFLLLKTCDVHEDGSYMQEDYGTECSSRLYDQTIQYCIFCVALFPIGTPCKDNPAP